MKNFHCHISLLMSVAVFAVIAATVPYNAVASQMSHEAILTEWATAKGWIV